MASSEQAIRVSARGEFGQLQRGLKDLQGNLKGVFTEIDKGARKGGIFDESQLRALDLFQKRFKGTMGEMNKEFTKQTEAIDKLYERMNKATRTERENIRKQVEARERELDVIRKQANEMERLYKKRTSEAQGYGAYSDSGTGASGSATTVGALSAVLSKATGAIGTIAKFGMGLAGAGSLIAMAQGAYQEAYQRNVGSLDLAQRLRGNGFRGSATGMYDSVSAIGRRDNMGYTQMQSWQLQDAYTSRAGALGAEGQYALQKFSRGYGLDSTQLGDTVAGVKQLGGITSPKEFADMIAGSVSSSGMVPRIMEVMQTHTGLLSNLNTTFKNGTSQQILAYQTTLDRIGNQNNMALLTGQQGANVIGGIGGIYQPGESKWKWMGINALQQYKPDTYGKMDIYDLMMNFEDGLNNADNVPAMAKYMQGLSGGNQKMTGLLMQNWLRDGGFNAPQRKVRELMEVTDNFSVFDEDKMNAVMGGSIDSGTKYDEERKDEFGQNILSAEAELAKKLEVAGQPLLEIVQKVKAEFIDLLGIITSDKPLMDKAGDFKDLASGSTLEKVLIGIVGAKGAQTIIRAIGSRGDSKVPVSVDDIIKPPPTDSKLTGGQKTALNELSEGSASKRKLLEEDLLKHGDLDKTAKLAEKTPAGGIADKVKDSLSKTKVGEIVSTASTKTGGKLLSKIPVIGGLLDFGINKLMGDSTGRALTRAVGAGIGATSGAVVGAFAGGAGAIPGAMLGGTGGDIAGAKAYDFFAGLKGTEKASVQLEAMAIGGSAALDALEAYGGDRFSEMHKVTKNNMDTIATEHSGVKRATSEVEDMAVGGNESLTALKTSGSGNFTDMLKVTETAMSNIADEHKGLKSIFKDFLGFVGLGGGSTSGTGGFFSGWDNRITSPFGAFRGFSRHSGLDIAGKQGEPLEALIGGVVSSITMDDGGKYDTDGKKNTKVDGTQVTVKMPDGSSYSYKHLSKVNPQILEAYMRGDKNITVGAGDYLGNIGGAPNVAGSGYNTTGSHLHLGYQSATGKALDPATLLNSLSSMGALNNTAVGNTSRLSIDINLKGDVEKLSNMTQSALKNLIEHTVLEIQRRNTSMFPSMTGGR